MKHFVSDVMEVLDAQHTPEPSIELGTVQAMEIVRMRTPESWYSGAIREAQVSIPMPSGAPLRILPSEHVSDFDLSTNGLIVGDALEVLKALPSSCFRTCVTSPPYWGVRDYKYQGQIGAEGQLAEYIENLCLVFGEVWRVLKEDGTLWLNIGDTYTSGNRTWRDNDKKNPARAMSYRPPTPGGLKPKDLIGIPWRVAFALQNAGWYLRSEVIWHKPNCQPESVKDRPTRAHEHIFLLTKADRYYYDWRSCQEPANGNGKMKNRRSVWSVNTDPFPGAHSATFPPDLIEPCIAAGSQNGDFVLDPFFGSGTVGEVCIDLNRSFVGVEVKPEYAALAASRLEGHYMKG